jgi:hypothetical protein
MSRIAAALTLALLAFIASSASAAPITYTLLVQAETGNCGLGLCIGPEGRLGTVSFGGSSAYPHVALTFTFEGDTSNVVPWNVSGFKGYEIITGIASVSVIDVITGAVLVQGTFCDGTSCNPPAGTPLPGIFVSVDDSNGGIGFGSFGGSPSSPAFPGQPVYPFGLTAFPISYDLQGSVTITGGAESCVNFPQSPCGTLAPGPSLWTTSGDLVILSHTALSATFTAQAGPTFVFRFIDVPPQIGSIPCVQEFGLNDQGQVVGDDCSGSQEAAWVWTNGAIQTLPQHPQAGPHGGTGGLGISNQGEVVGSYVDAAGVEHGAIYANGAWSSGPIDHPGASTTVQGILNGTEFRGIAPGGAAKGITGIYSTQAGRVEAFVYQPGRSVMNADPTVAWQDLDGGSDPLYGMLNSIVPLPASNGLEAETLAHGINDLGVIVGNRRAPYLDAFVYSGGSSVIPQPCPLLPAPQPSGCAPRATFFDLVPAGVVHGTVGARGISASGDVSGWFVNPAGTVVHGFLRSSSGNWAQVDAPGYSGYTIVNGVNGLGQMSGFVFDPTQPLNIAAGGIRAFIATPTSSPASVSAGAFLFNIAVTAGPTYFIDPPIVTGYEYRTAAGNPNFASVRLPVGINSAQFEIQVGDDDSNATYYVSGGERFDFTKISPRGVRQFRVLHISPAAKLNPTNANAFVTGLTFVAAGVFTGTMRPLADD